MKVEELLLNENIFMNDKDELSVILNHSFGILVSITQKASINTLEISNMDFNFTLNMTDDEMEALIALMVCHCLEVNE